MRRVCIVGGKGNMGRRYACIMKELGIEVVVADVGDAIPGAVDGYIIATPTPTHIEVIESLFKFKQPILCEKPVSTDANAVRSICREAMAREVPLDVIMQYRELERAPTAGLPFLSLYNYWNHGKDGLHWDCFQIFALAQGPVIVAEDSPFWECVVNNHRLDIADMDKAYFVHLARWAANPQQRADAVMHYHDKVAKAISEMTR